MMYVVDDAADYRFLVQEVFKRFLPQYPLRLFADGFELIQSIEIANESPPTNQEKSNPIIPRLIVLDIDMPKLNGFQILDQLKQNPLWQSTPVVMMSSRLESEFSEAAIAGGAVSCIPKPMSLAEFQQVMTQLCHQWLDT
ncbi:response regulator [Spirosoma litoris]